MAFLVAGAPVAAQDLTDEELLDLFHQQRDAVVAAESGDLGTTRGLEFIPVDDLVTEPELAQEEAAATGATPDAAAVTAEEEVPDADTDAVEVATTEAEPEEAPDGGAVVYASLPSPLQVNVRVSFPFDSAALTNDQLPKLAQLCNVMRASDIGLFRIVGHTDAAGNDGYNEQLSLLRAQEVRRYLVDTCGMASERLEAVGMGERFLADPNDPQGADNRRVEFQALS